MTRTALVTGGAGFIGSHLVARLANDGWRVEVIDDWRSAPVVPGQLVADWSREINEDAAEPYTLTIADVLAVSRPRFEPDVIYHCAGPVGATGVIKLAGSIVPSIVDLGRHVARWAVKYGCPLVFVATSESYGGVGGECAETSDRIFAPGHSARQEYAIAKLAAETMLLNWPALDVRIVRPFNVAGPRQSGATGFVTPRFVAQALRGWPLTVYTPGSQQRAFTHVLDEVDGIIRAYSHGEAGGIYNLGNVANRTTIIEYAELVRDVLGSESEITIVDPRELHGSAYREAPDKYPAPSAAAASLGWYPFRDLRAIIGDAATYAESTGLVEWLG